MNFKKLSLMSLLAGTLLGISLSQPSPALAQKENKEGQRWEYKYSRFQTGSMAEDLNAAGEQGWELVAAGGDGDSRYFFFKRPKLAGGPNQVAAVLQQVKARVERIAPGDAPAVTLQEAIQLAEEYAKREKFDLSKHYLGSARLIVRPDAAKKQAWQVIWEFMGKASDAQHEFIIDMDKNVTRIPGG